MSSFAHLRECRANTHAQYSDRLFFSGYRSFVGDYYDLSVGRRPFRILMLPMSYGSNPDWRHRTFKTRHDATIDGGRTSCVRRAPHRGDRELRNRHMSGMTYATRLLLGLGLKDLDPCSEIIEIRDRQRGLVNPHLYDVFAWVNYLQCSSLAPNSRKDRSTRVMRRNCSTHVREIIGILEPNLIVAQGTAGWLEANDLSENNGRLETIRIGGNSCLLLNFVHPSGGPKG